MPWYYYSGSKPVPIAVGDGSGEVRSMQPHQKVEIFPSSDNDAVIRTQTKLGHLKLCGAPKDPQVQAQVEGGPGDLPPPKSGSGEPLKFNEFLVKEGDKRVGRPDVAESVAPVDRQQGDVDSGPKVDAAPEGDVQGKSTSRKRRRRGTSS